MLELKNISAGYGADDVIKEINLSVAPSECISIIGPNGCGKSTLLKVIAGLLPYKGEVLLNGQAIKAMKRTMLASKIALLSQMSALYFSYSVFDTVMMGRYVYNKGKLSSVPSKNDREIVLNCLSATNLLDLQDSDITKLSGGQLQRVFLARALAQDPQIILLDEPTNHLDFKHQIELVNYLKAWAIDNNRAIIGVLHDINLAMLLSDNVMIMHNGKCLAQGQGRDVVTDELLENVYEIDVASYMRQLCKWWG